MAPTRAAVCPMVLPRFLRVQRPGTPETCRLSCTGGSWMISRRVLAAAAGLGDVGRDVRYEVERAEARLACARLGAALQGAVLCACNVEHPSDIHPLWTLVMGDDE